MVEEKKVYFIWEKINYLGFVEKEYENFYFIVVVNFSFDMEEKYINWMIISKKVCEIVE